MKAGASAASCPPFEFVRGASGGLLAKGGAADVVVEYRKIKDGPAPIDEHYGGVMELIADEPKRDQSRKRVGG